MLSQGVIDELPKGKVKLHRSFRYVQLSQTRFVIFSLLKISKLIT